MRVRTFAASLLMLLTWAAAGSSQAAIRAPEPGSELTVTLVTLGQGEEVFERFGHNALWFHDRVTGADVAYQWGLFSFAEPHFIERFLSGENHYWMGGEDARQLIESSRRGGRPVTLQRLNLTPLQRVRLLDFVRWNAREENKYYRYDYFQDNCSTRLRDALDMAVGGAIKQRYDTARTALTFRGESLRLTDGDKPVETGIDIALGRPADAPITAWQSFFIPMRLRDALRSVTIAGADGAPVPIVADERAILPPPGPNVLHEETNVPVRGWRYLLSGLVLAAVIVALRIMMLTRRSAAFALALLGAGWSLLCGLLGVVLLLAWFATRHVFWASNENLLLLSPLSLLLVVLVPAAVLRNRFVSAARVTAGLVGALSLFALLLVLVPGGEQSQVVALFLPVHLALAWALALPRRSRESPRP